MRSPTAGETSHCPVHSAAPVPASAPASASHPQAESGPVCCSRRTADPPRHTATLSARAAVELLPDVRRFTAAALRCWGVDRDSAADAVLVVSELVGNAAAHSGSAHLDVRLALSGAAVRIDVTDAGAWRPVPVPAPAGAPDHAEYAERGRGLTLVRALAQGCGIAHADDGTRVWAVIGRTPPR